MAGQRQPNYATGSSPPAAMRAWCSSRQGRRAAPQRPRPGRRRRRPRRKGRYPGDLRRQPTDDVDAGDPPSTRLPAAPPTPPHRERPVRRSRLPGSSAALAFNAASSLEPADQLGEEDAAGAGPGVDNGGGFQQCVPDGLRRAISSRGAPARRPARQKDAPDPPGCRAQRARPPSAPQPRPQSGSRCRPTRLGDALDQRFGRCVLCRAAMRSPAARSKTGARSRSTSMTPRVDNTLSSGGSGGMAASVLFSSDPGLAPDAAGSKTPLGQPSLPR